MYRNDEDAQAARANALIDEIARLEREKVTLAATERRLEDARRELATFQPTPAPAAPRPPGLVAHLVVYSVAAVATFAAYTLLF